MRLVDWRRREARERRCVRDMCVSAYEMVVEGRVVKSSVWESSGRERVRRGKDKD